MYFIDTWALPNGTRIDAHVCIVGAGDAGFSVTDALADRFLRLALVESGGPSFDEQTGLSAWEKS